MFSNTDISLIFDIAFFVGCIVLISHMFLSSFNRDIRKEFLGFIVFYATLAIIFDNFEHIFIYKNSPSYEFLIGSAIGGIIGLIAASYLGYQFCVLTGIFDNKSFIYDSSITLAITIGVGEMGRQLGGFLGHLLLTIF